jgi:hypothetical protein
LQKRKRGIAQRHVPERLAILIVKACGQVARSHSGADMTTPLHSDKNLLLLPKLSLARAHALASHRLPVTLTLAAIILSVLGVKP